jgi:hypothetical protein
LCLVLNTSDNTIVLSIYESVHFPFFLIDVGTMRNLGYDKRSPLPY